MRVKLKHTDGDGQIKSVVVDLDKFVHAEEICGRTLAITYADAFKNIIEKQIRFGTRAELDDALYTLTKHDHNTFSVTTSYA